MPGDVVAANTLEPRTETWRCLLAREALTTLVAESGGRIVGLAALGPARDDDLDPTAVGELAAMYVDPRDWGLGHGRALHAAAVDRLRAGGFGEAILWVLDANSRAREFYERHGWRLDGAEERDGGVHKVRYRLAL